MKVKVVCVLEIWPIISRKSDSQHFSTKERKSFLRVKMLNWCGYWGKGTLLWGNYHFWVLNDHLWGASVHVDKSFTKIQARVRPPPIPAMPGFWEFLFLEPLPKERTNFTWTVRFAQISLDLDAEIGDLLWFWVIFHICWICVKYLTNIMSEVGLLHLSGVPIVWGPTQGGPMAQVSVF